MDVPQDAPEHCPGTASESAGKATPCQGCPNQSICASDKPKEPDPDIAVIGDKLSRIPHKILVLSGKGGVGKSTFTTNMARYIAGTLGEDSNKEVAILDTDICGPSIPTIMGVSGEQVHQSGSGWSPVYADNIGVMSIGFLLGSADDAVIWRGPKKNGLIKQFLRDVDWSDVDTLVIDTPPGTSDEHLSVATYLGQARITGAVLLTTPQEVSLQDVRKEVNFCRKVGINIIGLVENMATFVCPKCTKSSEIFPSSQTSPSHKRGAERMCDEMGVTYLGQLPLDPNIGKCSDEGKSIFTECPESAAVKAYQEIITKIIKSCETNDADGT